jgi:hypothetical protein
MIALILAFLVFLIIGALCTGWPKGVRKFVINACETGRWGFWIAPKLMLRRAKKPAYLVELRLIGLGCLWGAVLCAWALLAAKR